MRKLFITMFIMVSSVIYTNAQIQSATLQASGLTCSMCSNSIHKALIKLPFIDSVRANIKTSSFDIQFKKELQVDIDQLRKTVEGAGFFVAGLTVNTSVPAQTIEKDAHIELDGRLFHFLNATGQSIAGPISFQIVDRGFVPAKTFKMNRKLTGMSCYKTGVTESCCSQAAGRRIYHVII
jgi:copper chaperone CopZ